MALKNLTDCLRLYLCTDRALLKGRSLLEVVEAAVAGGVTVVQLREKESSAREFYTVAAELLELTRRLGVPLIINDRLDIALAVGAAGVHLGQDDLSPAVARRLAAFYFASRGAAGRPEGVEFIVGVSAHNAEEAVLAEREGADYIGCGAMFQTGTKTDARVIGPAGLAAVAASVTIPVVGIGGVGKNNIAEIKAAGAAGAAVISAILSKDDIRNAAAELRAILDNPDGYRLAAEGQRHGIF